MINLEKSNSAQIISFDLSYKYKASPNNAQYSQSTTHTTNFFQELRNVLTVFRTKEIWQWKHINSFSPVNSNVDPLYHVLGLSHPYGFEIWSIFWNFTKLKKISLSFYLTRGKLNTTLMATVFTVLKNPLQLKCSRMSFTQCI